MIDGVPASPQHVSLEGIRLLFVVGPMVLGGAERQAVALARQLRDSFGANVQFLGIYGDGGPLGDYLDGCKIPWRIVHGPVIGARAPLSYRLRQVKLLFRFLRGIRSAEIDVILPYMTLPNIVTSLVWRFTSARLCVWNQRTDGGDAIELDVTQTVRLAARLATVFVANSRVGCEYIARHFGISPSDTFLVHNGVRLAAPGRSREEWRSELGADATTFVVVMIANLHPPKDHATLLRAWSLVAERLRSQGRRGILALAGRPVSTHGMLEELSSTLGVASSVRFLGLVRDVSGLLMASDLSAFASQREGMPNGVLESMAAGLAVVATDLPGVREALGPDCDRFLAPRGDFAALADRMIEVIENEELRRSTGEANRRRIEMEFSESRMGLDFATIISSRLLS